MTFDTCMTRTTLLSFTKFILPEVRMMRHLPDLLAVTGATLIVAGLWIIYPPIALIAAGVALMYAGYKIS